LQIFGFCPIIRHAYLEVEVILMGLPVEIDFLDYLEKGPFGHNPRIKEALGEIVALWQEASESSRTNKGRIANMLKILPKDLRIPQEVIPFEEKEGLRKSIEELIKEGKEIGLRTCFREAQIPKPATSPWIMGLKTENQVRAFFGEKPLSKFSRWRGWQETYNDWFEKYPGLEEIIVMGNPPGLGKENLRKKHFVFRAETVSINKLRVELRVGTDQLRDIEAGADRSDLIEITMEIPESAYRTYSPGLITVSPGRNYLRKPISQEALQEIRRRELIWPGKADFLLQPLPYKITKQVIETVFGQWCPQFYYTLSALNSFGLGGIEFQGRQDKGEVKWVLAHGLRGIKEERIPPRPPERAGGD
jgi:hypothetical protein